MTLLTRIRKGNQLCSQVAQLREFGRFYAAEINKATYYTFTPFQAAVLQEFGAQLEFYETDRPYYHTYPATKVKLKQIDSLGTVDKEGVEELAAILREDLSGD